VKEAIIDILFISLGLVCVIFPRAVARHGIRQNNQFFRLISIRTNFGEREEKGGAMLVIFPGGIFFVVIGILSLMGVG
jgi:hypothetical protein